MYPAKINIDFSRQYSIVKLIYKRCVKTERWSDGGNSITIGHQCQSQSVVISDHVTRLPPVSK